MFLKYYVLTQDLELFLLTIYSKNELENLNDIELQNLLKNVKL